MKEQKQKAVHGLTIHNISLKSPFFLSPSKQISDLQSKVTFYQGQFDPLYTENQSAKQNYLNLSKMVSFSTQVLRNLLPVGNNPAKQLKLQMSTIDQIAKMIEADWKQKENQMTTLTNQKQELRENIATLLKQIQQEYTLKLKQMKQLQESKLELKEHYEHEIANLNAQINKQRQDLKLSKIQAHQQQKLRDNIIQLLNKEFSILKHQSGLKYNDYQRHISRINRQMESNLLQFQQAKNYIKSTYQSKINEKLLDQAQTYEEILKLKEDQKLGIQRSMGEVTSQLQKDLNATNQKLYSSMILNNKLRKQLQQLQKELYFKKQEAQKKKKMVKQLNFQNSKNIQKIQQLQKKVVEGKITIVQQQQKINSIMKKYQNDLQSQKKKEKDKTNQLLAQKIRLQRQFLSYSTKQQKEKEELQALKKQYHNMIDKNRKRQQQLILQLQTNAQKYSRQRQILQKQKQQLGEWVQQRHIVIKQLQQSFELAKTALVKQHNKKMQELIIQHQQSIIKIKIQYQREQAQQNFLIKQQYQQTIHERVKQLQRQIDRYEYQMRLSKNKQISLHQEVLQLNHLIKSKEIQQARMVKQLQQKINYFVKELSSKSLQLYELQQKITNKESNIDLEKGQISSLQKQLQFKLKQVQNMHQKELNLIKAENQKQINHLKFQCNHLIGLIAAYLRKISNKRQSNQGYNTLINLTFQQKIGLIEKIFEQFSSNIKERDELINNLQCTIRRYEKQIQNQAMERRKNIENQLSSIINDCNQKILNKQEECKIKVQIVLNQRIAFSQEIFKEFSHLKQHHNKTYQILQQKYHQLENLLLHRPSRTQDLTKIKQLTSTKAKLDQQIHKIHKKIEKANQTVKYLNLQLENYKETYQIFGPNDQIITKNKTISFNTSPTSAIDLSKINQNENSHQRDIIHNHKNLRAYSQLANESKILTKKQQGISETLIKNRQIKPKKYTIRPEKIFPINLRFKTQKILDEQKSIFKHAQTFMKFIKDQSSPKEFEETQQLKKANYRKRRIKKLSTGEQYYV